MWYAGFNLYLPAFPILVPFWYEVGPKRNRIMNAVVDLGPYTHTIENKARIRYGEESWQ
jgi:hypothetical protein